MTRLTRNSVHIVHIPTSNDSVSTHIVYYAGATTYILYQSNFYCLFETLKPIGPSLARGALMV